MAKELSREVLESIRELDSSIEKIKDSAAIDCVISFCDRNDIRLPKDIAKVVSKLSKAVPFKYVSSSETIVDAIAKWIETDEDDVKKGL